MAETEIVTLAGREIKLHWKSPRFQEWLAWCYVPAPDLSPMGGVGFEARAATPEAARQELLDRVKRHLGVD